MALTAAALVTVAHTGTRARATEVDLLLALAADVSGSVDDLKFSLQREGYSAAITSPRVIEAIRSGRLGRIAICYIEWSGTRNQKVLIDWTVIQDAASAHRFAGQLAEAPRPFFDHTSVSGGIGFAMSQIERAPFEAKRRVIDVSGDGDDDNSGGDVTLRATRCSLRGLQSMHSSFPKISLSYGRTILFIRGTVLNGIAAKKSSAGRCLRDGGEGFGGRPR